MECKFCGKEMTDPATKSCLNVPFNFPGEEGVRPIAHQDNEGRRCRDCNVVTGGWHHPGCARERCPRCWGQAVNCEYARRGAELQLEPPVEDTPKKPRWTGKPFSSMKIEGFLIPWHRHQDQPLLIRLDGCDDWFLPIFSNEGKLYVTVAYLIVRGLVEMEPTPPGQVPFKIKQVDKDGQTEFLTSVFEGGVRVMVDPQILSDTHTKWIEVVFSGDEYKLIGQGGADDD
jgi:hypothetical protein